MSAAPYLLGVVFAVIGALVIFRNRPSKIQPSETDREAHNRNARAAAAWHSTDNTYQDYDGVWRTL